MSGAKSDYALMRSAAGGPVQRIARLEAKRHGALARQIDDLLEPRAAGAPGNQNAVQGPAGAQGFADRMNAGQDVTCRLVWMGTARGAGFRRFQCKKA